MALIQLTEDMSREEMIATQNTNNAMQYAYPVGSIYMSANSTDPKMLFGGTWERYANGRVLVGVDEADTDFNTAGKTGGAKTHTLTVNEMPNHEHPLELNTYTSSVRDNTYVAGCAGGSGLGNANSDTTINARRAVAVGGGQAHNNLPPYITCYMWVRTA